MMKKFLLLTVLISMSICLKAQIYNTAPKGNTWYKIKTRKQHLCTITTKGSYAEHRSVVFLISGIWNTAEVTTVAEYNYDHMTMDVIWGYVGSGASRYLAIKTVPLSTTSVQGFTIKELENEDTLIELEEIGAPDGLILPQSTIHVDEHAKKVGIGTTTPTSLLSVAGTIDAREVKVEIGAGAPDYVFADDYHLSTLEETATFIKENHHLPEIPSASQIEADGVNLGEMNMLLLKKIEELTLHLIEKDKQLNDVVQRLNKIENK
ncbi:MAG: hypothetical protein ABJH72_25580 [Reichenbachiella sp.]|uniref:hypothetical protein n=1 Tax=Reichenbachiella sp. TaxID=2184521 RepID=UPI003265AFCA